MRKNPGQVSITFEYARHVGPKYLHGAVKLSFDAMQSYSFKSLAKWPAGESYEEAIRESVEAVLKERMGSLAMVAVVLQSITWDEVNSCEIGFRNAARAATEAAFEF